MKCENLLPASTFLIPLQVTPLPTFTRLALNSAAFLEIGRTFITVTMPTCFTSTTVSHVSDTLQTSRPWMISIIINLSKSHLVFHQRILINFNATSVKFAPPPRAPSAMLATLTLFSNVNTVNAKFELASSGLRSWQEQ